MSECYFKGMEWMERLDRMEKYVASREALPGWTFKEHYKDQASFYFQRPLTWFEKWQKKPPYPTILVESMIEYDGRITERHVKEI